MRYSFTFLSKERTVEKKFRCPVCGKPLTEAEYDKALGLWKEKQAHIQHLEAERRKLKDQERANREKLALERKKYKDQERLFRRDMRRQSENFRKSLAAERRNAAKQLREQQSNLKKTFDSKLKLEVKKGIQSGVAEQKKQLQKQQGELRKTKNKMSQLENSLKVSAKKYEQANEEIKKLKAQIEKGITPQIEGLLEEGVLLAKLKELFPHDRFEHPGKGGDIIQTVVEQEKEIGKIVYECKKVKPPFQKKYIDQAKEARRFRDADFAILVTNVFPAKKQYYFVEKTVFVISPVSLEPIVYTLRDSLVAIALLKLSNEAKQKAVQRVYDYLSSNDYNNKINDVANQLVELAKDLKAEIASHKRTWEKRYHIYRSVYMDVGVIDGRLKGLLQDRVESVPKPLLLEKGKFIEIEELKKLIVSDLYFRVGTCL